MQSPCWTHADAGDLGAAKRWEARERCEVRLGARVRIAPVSPWRVVLDECREPK